MTLTSTEELLVFTNLFTAFLFVLSEILAMSTCEYNGVIHFVFSGCSCLGNKRMRVDVEVVAIPEIIEVVHRS